MSASPQLVPALQQSVPKLSQTRIRKLSIKEKRFLTAYFQTQDATQAALAIGCSAKSARTTGYKILQRKHVAAAIDAELEKQGISVAYVLEHTRAIVEDEKTRNADKLTGLTLIAKHLGMLRDNIEVNVTHDLADRVAKARAQVTQLKAINAG